MDIILKLLLWMNWGNIVMRLREYYENMSIEDVNMLNKAWGLTDTVVESKCYFKNQALNLWLENGRFKEALTDEECDKFIGQKTREYLKYKVLGYNLFDCDIEQDLREKCIIVENEMLDDFTEMMIEYIKFKAITIMDDEPIEVISTPFLQLILITNYVHSNSLEIDEMFKRVDIESSLVSGKSFTNYLSIRQILTDDKKYINTRELSKWINNEAESIHDFYKFITVQINAKGIFDFLKIIMKAFNSSDDWIAIKEFEKIFKKFEKEIAMGIRLGLILLKDYDKKPYMQFSPEGWLLATGKRPNLWNNKEILITPLKEVFIPFNFDPFVIQKFDYLGCPNTDKDSSKRVYYDDYYIVSKIPETQGIRDLVQFTELAKYIEEYCENIPDVVSYKIFRG